MDTYDVKQLLDMCYLAKRVTENMPDLPKGIVSRHIHIIDAIYEINKKKGSVYVSDISQMLNRTTPSITKLVNELVTLGCIEKENIKEDKRYFLLSLTEKGNEYYEKYIKAYHTELAEKLNMITEEDIKITVNTINLLYDKTKCLLEENNDW